MRALLAGAVVALVVLSGAVTPVAGQSSDPVTLTVSVETPDGDPVGQATIHATWDGGSATESTASNGKAFIDVPEGADVRLEIDHPDFVRNTPYAVADAEAQDVAVTVYPKATFRVTARTGGSPVSDAAVTLRKHGSVVARGQTDADGRFGVGPIEAGDYTYAVEKPGYYRVADAVTVSDTTARTARLESGSVPLEVNVTDSHFSPARPIPGAQITVRRDGSVVAQVATLENGKQETRVPVNTDLSLTVTKDGYETVEGTVSVSESAISTDLDVSRTPVVNLTALNTQVVAGQRVPVSVVDEYGEAVANATILRNGAEAATTNADGEAKVQIPETGAHELVARTDGRTSAPVSVTGVSPGDETTTTATTTATTTTTTRTTTATTASDGQPGFTALAAVLALVLALAAGRRRS
ncbi:MAG: carboxypeptidase regulatory-like domain-containing protein [Halobacteriaceae archaeon]